MILLLMGCSSGQKLDRFEFDLRYEQTQFDQGVVSVLPLQINQDLPPRVVNWWYAGSTDLEHVLVFRELAWDAFGQPKGTEYRYRILRHALAIHHPFVYSNESAMWLPLYEASSEIKPPSDLTTVRQSANPLDREPEKLPTQLNPPDAP